MKKKTKRTLAIAGIGAFAAFVIGTMIVSAISCSHADRVIRENDLFFEEYEKHRLEIRKPAYSWQEQLCAKIVGFECGFCCDICRYYTASACVNRMNDWYNGDPVAMVTDKNDSYYMMNPDYADIDCIEVNGWNYFLYAEEMLKVIKEAEENPAEVYYWDCEDTQRDWAELVFICPTDHMYFYK